MSEAKLNLTMEGQRIIGFAGYAGAGKDTVANALPYPKTSFASTLKTDLYPIFNKLGLDITRREDKEVGRDLLVAYGKLARIVDPNFWINNLFIPQSPVVLVTDVRYANEGKAIIESGGVVFYIERPLTGPANSEEANSIRELRNQVPMPVIANDGTTPAAGEFVKHAVELWLSALNGVSCGVGGNCNEGYCDCD